MAILNPISPTTDIIISKLFNVIQLDKTELKEFFNNPEAREVLLAYFFISRAVGDMNNINVLDAQINVFLKDFLYEDLLKRANPTIQLVDTESDFDRHILVFEYTEYNEDETRLTYEETFKLDLSRINTTLLMSLKKKHSSYISSKLYTEEDKKSVIDSKIRESVSTGDISNAVKLGNSALAETEQTDLQKRNKVSKVSEKDAKTQLEIFQRQETHFANTFLLQTKIMGAEEMKEVLIKHFDKLIDAEKSLKRKQ